MAVNPVGVKPRRPVKLQVRPNRAVRGPIDDLICLCDVRACPVLAGDQDEDLPNENAILSEHRQLIWIIGHHLYCNVLTMDILIEDEHSLRELPENAYGQHNLKQKSEYHFIYYNPLL